MVANPYLPLPHSLCPLSYPPFGLSLFRFAGASIAIKIGTVTPGIKAFVEALNEAIAIFTAKAEEEAASGVPAIEAAPEAEAAPVQTAAELSNAMSEEEVAGCCPATITVDAHEHELTLSFGTVYGHGQYGCNVCSQMGTGGNYQCAECSWDAHPHCVVPALVESVRLLRHVIFIFILAKLLNTECSLLRTAAGVFRSRDRRSVFFPLSVFVLNPPAYVVTCFAGRFGGVASSVLSLAPLHALSRLAHRCPSRPWLRATRTRSLLPRATRSPSCRSRWVLSTTSCSRRR